MGSIPVGSTKKQTQTCLLLLSLRRIERLLTQPDSRTLGVLADTREYQNGCEDSRFYMMKRKGWRFRTHKGCSEISFDKWKTTGLRAKNKGKKSGIKKKKRDAVGSTPIRQAIFSVTSCVEWLFFYAYTSHKLFPQFTCATIYFSPQWKLNQ